MFARLSKIHDQGKTSGSRAGIIPLDNLILFVHNPGAHKEPDKRTMFRLLQNASIEYTGLNKLVRVQNPYLCFLTPILDQVLTLFKRKYFRSYRFDTLWKAKWKVTKSLSFFRLMGLFSDWWFWIGDEEEQSIQQENIQQERAGR